MADGRSVRDAMVAGQLDAGTMNITPFIVGAVASGLTMVGVVSLGGDTVGVVARKGAGIDGIADLKGRRVGISVGSTTGNIFVRTVAPQAGLKPGDYQVVNMRPADQVAALAAGSVDAITSFEPYMTVAETEGIGVTLMRFGAIDPNPTCLVLTPGLIEEPAIAVRFLKSWLDGVDYWRSHTARSPTCWCNCRARPATPTSPGRSPRRWCGRSRSSPTSRRRSPTTSSARPSR